MAIHFSFTTPSCGSTSIGKIKATMMPEIMMVAMLLNTAKTPLCSEFLVESGTIRL